jgi:tetratricopeptide (TPR) repeat protein
MELFDWLKNTDNFKAVTPIITAIITILCSGVLIGIVWPALVNCQKRRRKRQIPAGISPLLVLPPGTKNVLRQLMGATEQNQDDPLADFNIVYQHRQPDREIRKELETALNANDWVLVLGKTGIGKTREVCHLAELLNGEGWQVIKLKDGGDTWLDEPKQLPDKINREQNALFIIDDLNRWVRRGNPLEISPAAEDPLQPLRAAVPEQLLRMLTFYQAELRGRVKVIATARNEPEEWAKLEIDKYPRFWQKFYQYSLPAPADNAIVSLLTERVEEARMAGKPEDYPEIAKKNDSTFRNIIENLRVAKNRQLTVENGQFATNLTETWREKYSQAVKKDPAARYVYDAVELLRGLNLMLHPHLVRETARLINSERGFRRLKVWLQMGSVVEYLSQQEGILQPRDGQIEGKSTPMMTVDKVAPQKIIRLLTDVWAGSSGTLVNEVFDLGNALYKLGRLDDAVASYDKAIEFKPNKDEAWNNRGIALYKLGRLDDAVASYDKAIEFKPDNDEAWYNRGIALDTLGRLDDAVASYDKAIEFKPDNHEAWYNRGNALGTLGRLDEAIASYDKAIEFKPDDDEAWNNRGIALRRLGRLDEAIASYDKAIEFKPDKDEAWNNRGIALRRLGRLDDAIASYDKAIEFKPDNPETWDNRGVALRRLGRLDDAVASYDKAIEFKPDKDEAWYNRGVALDTLGRLDDAVASYDKAIEFKPDKDEAWYNRGIALRRLGRLDDAVASYDKAIEFKPDNPETWDNRGVALSKLGKLEAAISSHDRALQIQPQFSSAIYNLACCHALQGNIDESIDYLQQAIQLDPNHYINLARQDDDFRSIRNDPRFIALFNLGISE